MDLLLNSEVKGSAEKNVLIKAHHGAAEISTLTISRFQSRLYEQLGPDDSLAGDCPVHSQSLPIRYK